MKWGAAPLEVVAPAQGSDLRFGPDEVVWHLTLDQIEAHTGRILEKIQRPFAEAGTSTFVFDDRNVLYSKLRPYLNKVVCPTEPGVATTELVPFRPDPRVLDRNFLAYYLRSPRFLAFASNTVAGVKMPRVIMSKLWEHEIPLPPLSEQRRIVEILDQADALRRKRAEADAKAARILPALFYKMFGDPATNPKGWPIVRLGDVCDIVSGATPRTDRPEFWDGGVLWATPKDLSQQNEWILDRTERTITEEGLSSCATTLLPEGAVLLSSRAPIGLVAIAGRPLCTNQGFKSFVCGQNVDSWYLFAWCKLRTVYLQSLGRGATFAEISKTIVESIPIPLPPVEAQRSFRALVLIIENLRRRSRLEGSALERLFQTLLHRAFTGDLTARWREAHMKELLAEMEAQARILEAVQ
jgi:type I restriction enzyme S subunit